MQIVAFISLSYLVIGIALTIWPMQARNKFFGYRSRRSMRDQASWEFANRKLSQYLIVLGGVSLIVAALCLGGEAADVFAMPEGFAISALVIQGIFLLLMALRIENLLKQHRER